MATESALVRPRRIALLSAAALFALTGAGGVGFLGSAWARPAPTQANVPGPAITVDSPTVELGGTITINGTGCEANGDAIVHEFTGWGTPSENLVGTDYPIATDATGAFTVHHTISSNQGFADGTVITIVGQCPFAENAPSLGPVTVTVGPAQTSSTTTSTTAAPTSTTATPTTAPPVVAPIAKPVPAAPPFTG